MFESLIAGGSIEVALDENVVLSDIRKDPDTLSSSLSSSGYLEKRSRPADALGAPMYRLSIPNLEVRGVYATSFRGWMRERMETSGGSVAALTKALLGGDAETFEEELQAFVTNVLSYHDPGNSTRARLSGLLRWGSSPCSTPGRRSRPGIWQGPSRRGDPPRDPRQAWCRDRAQGGPREKDAGTSPLGGSHPASGSDPAPFVAAGATPIHRFAVAFDGKEVRVRSA